MSIWRSLWTRVQGPRAEAAPRGPDHIESYRAAYGTAVAATPLSVIASVDAYQTAERNPANTWPKRGDAENRVEPICKPAFQPSFTFRDRESVFTIGSCFARNVEHKLELLGFDVPMRRLELVAAYEGSAENNPNIFNNYAVPSIFNELQWALDRAFAFDAESCLLELEPGKFCDLHLTRLLEPVSLDEAMERRRRIQSSMAKVKDCRVVILTLGLIEAWYDNRSQRYLNVAPPRAAADHEPERFEVHIMRYEQVMLYLRKIMTLLREHCREDQRVILTVSPIPLAQTFTSNDVIVANAYSKAVLRASAQEIAVEYPNIDYFPCYESVIHTDRATAWQDDQRHVTHELIAENVDQLVTAYTGRPTSSPKVEQGAEAEKRRDHMAAANLYREALGELPYRTDLKIRLARCLLALGELDEAQNLVEALVDDRLRGDEAFIVLAQVKRRRGDLAAHDDMYPRLLQTKRQAGIREAVLGSFDAGDDERVMQACEAMTQLAPGSATVFEYLARMAHRRGEFVQAEAILLEGLAHDQPQSSALIYILLGEVQSQLGKRAKAEEAFRRALELSPGNRGAQEGLAKLLVSDAAEVG